MLFVPCLPGDEVCGDYTREQLIEMNDRFVAAVEATFAAGLESPSAAQATVKVNGKQAANGRGDYRAGLALVCRSKISGDGFRSYGSLSWRCLRACAGRF